MPFPLADFTARLLTHHGALVEQDQNEIVAVVPPHLAVALEVAEYQRFTFDPRAGTHRGLAVDYDSPLVDRFERLVEALGRIACVTAPRLPLKTIDPEEVVTGAITLTNGIIRDCRAESGRAQYVGFLVRYELLADERISGMTEVWVNTTTRSAPRLEGFAVRLLSRHEESSEPSAEAAASGAVFGVVADAWKSATALATGAVEMRLQDAIASLRRRRERDFTRLREYYEAIDGEIRRRARRAMAKGNEAAVEGEASRLEATARAFRARVGDLVERYRVRVLLTPLAAIECALPVHVVTARVHRRSASRTIALTWNAVDRELEPPRCDGCGTGTSTAALCDDRVHLLCSSCHHSCETCGRPYCRACHTRCPRPH